MKTEAKSASAHNGISRSSLRYLFLIITYTTLLGKVNSLNCQIPLQLDAGVYFYLNDDLTAPISGAYNRINSVSTGKFSNLRYGNSDANSKMGVIMNHLNWLYDASILYRSQGYPNISERTFIINSLTFLDSAFSADNNAFCGEPATWNDVVLGVPERINKIFAVLKPIPDPNFRIDTYPNLLAISYYQNDGALVRCAKDPPIHQGGDQMIWYLIKLLHFYNLSEWDSAVATIDSVTSVIESDYFTPGDGTKPGEGLRSDYSFHDHGSQLYHSRYGLGGYLRYASHIDKISYFLDDRLLLPESNAYHLITNYAHTFIGHMFWDDILDFTAIGRGVALNDGLKFHNDRARMFHYLTFIDPDHDLLYQAIDGSDDLNPDTTYSTSFHAHSWESDYMIHRMPEWYFSVRMASSRVARQERSGTGINSKNRYTSNGATNISLRRNQYYNVMPSAGFVWEVYPGTTSMFFGDHALIKPWGAGERNLSDYCGGTAVNGNGISAYWHDDDLPLTIDTIVSPEKVDTVRLYAKKSWSCFQDGIYCIGSAIGNEVESINPNNLSLTFTTANQSRLHGNIYYKRINDLNVQTAPTNNGMVFYGANYVHKIWHDSIGYIFPSDHIVYLGVRNFVDKLFYCLIQHIPHNPIRRKYEYTIVPNIDSATFFHSYNSPMVSIRNTDEIHASYHRKDSILQVACFEPGKYDLGNGNYILTNRSCVLTLDKFTNQNQKTLAITDPTQQNSKVRLAWKIDNWEEQVDITYPQGQEFQGKQMTLPFNRDKGGHYDMLFPTMDTYTMNGTQTNQGHGDLNYLVVKKGGSNHSRKTFLKFNLQDLDPNFDGRVLLRLKLFSIPDIDSERLYIQKVVDDNWRENRVTYSNSGNLVGVGPKVESDYQAHNYLQFDLTELVKEERKGDQILSLVLGSEGDSGANGYFSFYSKDYSNVQFWPRLIFYEKNLEIPVKEDAYVQWDLPNTNFESIHPNDLKIKLDGSKTREAYLKFALADSILDFGNQAFLKMHCNILNPQSSTAPTKVSRALHSDWANSKLKWNNKPIHNEETAEIESRFGYSWWDISNLFFNPIYEKEEYLTLILKALSSHFQVFCSENCSPEFQPKIEIYNQPSIFQTQGNTLSPRINICDPGTTYAEIKDIYVTQNGEERMNLIDCDPSSRWSAEAQNGIYEQIVFELISPTTIEGFDIDFYKGADRTNTFKVRLFDEDWNLVNPGELVFTSSLVGTFQPFDYQAPYQNVKYIVYYGHGNSLPNNDWVSLEEIRFRK